MYFLTPLKCAVFEINCEAFPKQVNFLIDEGMSISKGSNAVISYLHFFDNYGLGEEITRLHCDNCSGQNKNKFVMWYLAWRCIHRLHKSMELYFLVAGHTNFSPDWCFGLFKQRYRRSHITALCDIQEAVRSSSYQNINIPQLVGSEDGQVLVNTYNWQEFLSPYFKPLPQIKNYHHMRFNCDHPGVIFAKQYADSKEVSFSLLKDPTTLPPLELPLPLAPPGLSEQRIQYLYNNIRQFCAQDHRADLTCPILWGF
ncbi:hypothetical protein HOLleu_43109 [Holothuria leucospilota]|uniref:DUF7869 domain-containing protein n=1 Tax=Holothuria leucospilota TaxID=206669 RepID=A0A9Q1BBT7_HOLLE|nr:hypothetical protein HOLleu_43109 [Holothuria leucospilota]